MSEVLEEMLENEEKSHKVKTENRRLRKVIEELKDSVKQWTKMYDKLLDCARPENRQRDAIRKLTEIRLTVEETESRLTEMRGKLITKQRDYDELWEYSEGRKLLVKSLEKQLDLLKKKIKKKK